MIDLRDLSLERFSSSEKSQRFFLFAERTKREKISEISQMRLSQK